MENVRFLEPNRRGVLSLLEVESTERRDLLRALAETLLHHRVQLLEVESRTEGARKIERLTVVEFDGAPIRPARRLELQVAVLALLDRTRPAEPTTSSGQRSVVPQLA
jgi:UTP:GlnB (protein PII) uridylyltransferase